MVIATYDRPEDLRNCLNYLIQQKTKYVFEIVVVDNHPESGLTAVIVNEMAREMAVELAPELAPAPPRLVRVEEPRAGAAYARNAGIVASRGALIATVDDDVIVPPTWLDHLLEPFARPEVGIVTSNLLPLQLEMESERLFERHCSLSMGTDAFEIDQAWFRASSNAVTGWDFGVTASAAFRAEIFADPQVGLLEETLGPGTPVGAGEDPYLFYRAVAAGYTLVYHPRAFAWHRHRQSQAALHRQIFNYSKSAIAYHLMTLLVDGDRRALAALLRGLPHYYLRRLVLSGLGLMDYPWSLAWRECWGFIVGPWSLWQSHRRVHRLGRSAPYIPVHERLDLRENAPSLSCNALETSETLAPPVTS